MNRAIPLLIATFAAGAMYCQPSDTQPAFEVATIKPAVPFQGRGVFNFGSSGGPGTKDPGRYTCDHCSLADLIYQAYGLKRYQLSGPDWLGSEYFDVAAKVPDGVTRDQMKLMMRSLLLERFHMASHSEQRDSPIYGRRMSSAFDCRRCSARSSGPAVCATRRRRRRRSSIA